MNKKKANSKVSLYKTSRPNSTKDIDSRASAKQQIYALMALLLESGDAGVNRYETESTHAIAHLARRIKDLKELGCRFVWTNENAPDHQGAVHKGIRRYLLTFAPAHLQKTAIAFLEARHLSLQGGAA